MSFIHSYQTESFLRIAALSIGFYDYILTLPAEWRFYRAQRSILRPSIACALFFLIRYTSIIVIVVSNYGWFTHNFSYEDCREFFMVAPAFKVLQVMVSQVILGIRTYNIARRASWVKWFLIALFLLVSALEWVVNFRSRTADQWKGNCTTGNLNQQLSAWMFYLVAMIYDFLTLAIASILLIRVHTTDRRLLKLLRVMLLDGLGYFVVLTAANIFNLILYRSETDGPLQSAGVSIGYSVVWIMSQRILIRIQKVAEGSNDTEVGSVATPEQYHNSRGLTSCAPSQIDSHRPSPPFPEGDKALEVNMDSGDVENLERHRRPAITLNSLP